MTILKHQKAAVRKRPVTRTVESSTKKPDLTPTEARTMLRLVARQLASGQIPAGVSGRPETTLNVLDPLCPACAKAILGEALVAHARAMRPKKGTA